MATSPLPTLSSSPAFDARRTARTAGRDALYLVTGLPAGVIAFSVLVTMLSLAGGLAITLLGIPVLLGALYLARAMGDVERSRAALVLGTPVSRTPRRWTGGLWSRTKAAARDLGAWRDASWGLVLLPLGIAGFTVAVTAWSTALGLLTSPLWYWALPDNDDQPSEVLTALNSHAVGASVARAILGALLVPVAYFVCRGMAAATARAASAVLRR